MTENGPMQQNLKKKHEYGKIYSVCDLRNPRPLVGVNMEVQNILKHQYFSCFVGQVIFDSMPDSVTVVCSKKCYDFDQ